MFFFNMIECMLDADHLNFLQIPQEEESKFYTLFPLKLEIQNHTVRTYNLVTVNCQTTWIK